MLLLRLVVTLFLLIHKLDEIIKMQKILTLYKISQFEDKLIQEQEMQRQREEGQQNSVQEQTAFQDEEEEDEEEDEESERQTPESTESGRTAIFLKRK